MYSATLPSRLASKRPGSTQLPALTALRAPLAWLVVLFHFCALEPFRTATGGIFKPPLGNGPFAVDCFFILSGFVLFHVHSGIGFDGRQIWKFLLFRLARLYPVHLAVLLLFLVSIQGVTLLTGVQPNEPIRFTAVAFLEQILLIHGWGITGLLTWNYPSWSISSEWAAYLLAPAFFWLALRFPAGQTARLTVLAAVLLALILDTGVPSLWSSLPRVWLGFLLGVLICRVRDLHQDRLSQWRMAALAFCWSAFVVLLFSSLGGFFVLAFAGLLLFHGLPSAAASPRGLPGLPMRLLVYLGETSFAVYMGHAYVENVWLTLSRKLGLIGHGNILLTAALLVIVIQGFAMLLHHLVEEPARKEIRRLVNSSGIRIRSRMNIGTS